jgi:hypothetical protein
MQQAKVKIVLDGDDLTKSKVTIDDKVVFCERVELVATPNGIKATITIYDVHCEYQGSADIIARAPE